MRRSSPKADRAKPERPAHCRGAQSIRNHVAIAKELALGKKADDLALSNFFRRSANGGMRMADIDWDATYQPQERAENRSMVVLLVDDVADRAGTGELQDNGVNPGDVVRQKQKPARGYVFQAQRGDPIKATHNQPAKKMERAFSGGHGRHPL